MLLIELSLRCCLQCQSLVSYDDGPNMVILAPCATSHHDLAFTRSYKQTPSTSFVENKTCKPFPVQSKSCDPSDNAIAVRLCHSAMCLTLAATETIYPGTSAKMQSDHVATLKRHKSRIESGITLRFHTSRAKQTVKHKFRATISVAIFEDQTEASQSRSVRFHART